MSDESKVCGETPRSCLTGQAPLHHREVLNVPCPTSAQAPWSHRLSSLFSLMTCPAIGSAWARAPYLARARPTRRGGAAPTAVIGGFRLGSCTYMSVRWAWHSQGLSYTNTNIWKGKKNVQLWCQLSYVIILFHTDHITHIDCHQ